MFYLIVYDIPENRRRQKVHSLLTGYGQWVQYSTFECVLSVQQFAELKRRLAPYLKLDQDSVRFYPVSSHTFGRVEAWGVGPPINPGPQSTIV